MFEEGTPDLPLNDEDYRYIQGDIGKNSFELSAMVSSQPLSIPLLSDLDSVFEDEEDTMPLAAIEYKVDPHEYLADMFPPITPADICNTDYAGPLSFEVLIDPSGLKNPWEYSTKFNKVYIDLKQKFPINFSVKEFNDDPLFIRATPIYEEDLHLQDLVHRCLCHSQPQDQMNHGIPTHVIQHVMRCDNNKARYFGDKALNQRLSIVLPLNKPQPGTDSVKEYFHFVCKSSCPGGMNRRPIQVIFTLERVCGTILGRRVLCVRICSCPKRDREKEEAKHNKNAAPQGKKRKIEKKVATSSESYDTKAYPLNLNIIGEENYKQILHYAYNLMAGSIIKLEGKNVSDEPFRRSLNEINSLLNK